MSAQRIWEQALQQWLEEAPVLIDAASGEEYFPVRFFSSVDRLRKLLLQTGKKQFLLCLENSVLLSMLYFAAICANVELVPVDPQKSEEEKERIFRQHPEAERIDPLHATDLWEALQNAGEEKPVKLTELFAQTDYEKPYLITYTSGSTGEPKGVVHSVGNLIRSAASFRDKIGYKPGGRMYHIMPMTYMAGILNTLLLPFVSDCTIVLGKRFSIMEAVSFWKTTKKYGANYFWAAPTMLRMILTVDKKQTGAAVLKGVDTRFSVGTAPLDPGLREQFEETYGISLYQSYGLSETLFLTTQFPGGAADKTSVGELLAGVELRVMPDGEGRTRTPWNLLGYWTPSGLKPQAEIWYATGDLMTVQWENVRICGRKKELIIKGGMNLNPRDIELCLQTWCGVEQCAVQGIREDEDEKVVCWYIPEGENTQSKAFNSVIAAHLGKKYTVDYFIELKELPKNLNGKTDKKRLKQEWEEQRRGHNA